MIKKRQRRTALSRAKTEIINLLQTIDLYILEIRALTGRVDELKTSAITKDREHLLVLTEARRRTIPLKGIMGGIAANFLPDFIERIDITEMCQGPAKCTIITHGQVVLSETSKKKA
jgi:hypothetical protein